MENEVTLVLTHVNLIPDKTGAHPLFGFIEGDASERIYTISVDATTAGEIARANKAGDHNIQIVVERKFLIRVLPEREVAA